MGDGRGELRRPAPVSEGLVEAGDLLAEAFFQDYLVDIQALSGQVVEGAVDGFPDLVEEPGSFVDGQRGVVAPDMAHQGVENRRELGAYLGDVKDVFGIGPETILTLVGDDHRGCFVGLEDGRVLDDVADDGALGTGGADDDQRLGGEVDVLLVLHKIRGDRLVAQLAELNADFVRRRLVGATAHGGPIGLGGRQTPGRCLNGVAHGQYGAHVVGDPEQFRNLVREKLAGASALDAGHFEAQQGAGDDLGVKCLGGGHAHFDIPAAGGVQHAVHLEGDVRVPPVDDGQGVGASGLDHVHGAVGVGGRARLADGDHQGVGHAPGIVPFVQFEPAQLRGLECPQL